MKKRDRATDSPGTASCLRPAEIARLRPALDRLYREYDFAERVADPIELARRYTDPADREIVALQEFRTRLIADVVTGKLDVRAAAACLPDLAEAAAADEPTDDEDLEAKMDATEDEEVAA